MKYGERSYVQVITVLLESMCEHDGYKALRDLHDKWYTPRAALDSINLPCGRIICADMRRLALSDVRNLITYAALIA